MFRTVHTTYIFLPENCISCCQGDLNTMRHYSIVTQVRLGSLPLEYSTGQEQAFYAHQEQIKKDKVYKMSPSFKDTYIRGCSLSFRCPLGNA